MPVPPWLYTNLRRWHHLSFLRSRQTEALLAKIRHSGSTRTPPAPSVTATALLVVPKSIPTAGELTRRASS